MAPDDERHASWAGYVQGCRDECCRTAARNYQKLRVLDIHRGRPRRVSVEPTRRRAQALACLGWSGFDIARAAGKTGEWMRQVLNGESMWRTTHDAIAAIYDDMSMRIPPTDTSVRRQTVAKVKNRAANNGWLPPLAWEDIDAGVLAVTDGRAVFDEVVVERVLSGDWRLKCNAAERAEVVAAWTGTDGELERLTGWNVARERRRAVERSRVLSAACGTIDEGRHRGNGADPLTHYLPEQKGA